jgi:hypothetical protein
MHPKPLQAWGLCSGERLPPPDGPGEPIIVPPGRWAVPRRARTPLAPLCSAPSAQPASPRCLLSVPLARLADDESLRHR